MEVKNGEGFRASGHMGRREGMTRGRTRGG